MVILIKSDYMVKVSLTVWNHKSTITNPPHAAAFLRGNPPCQLTDTSACLPFTMKRQVCQKYDVTRYKITFENAPGLCSRRWYSFMIQPDPRRIQPDPGRIPISGFQPERCLGARPAPKQGKPRRSQWVAAEGGPYLPLTQQRLSYTHIVDSCLNPTKKKFKNRLNCFLQIEPFLRLKI